MKQLVRKTLETINLVPSRQYPFLHRRYPYRGRGAMLEALGSQLAAPTNWPATDNPPEGDLGIVLARTPGVHKWTHYLPIYEATIDRNHPIRMLEIGVFRGGSLRMWRQYLHPDSVIVGIDIDPKCKNFDDVEHQIHVRIGGQQDASFLKQVNEEFGPFDVILDDGSHMTSHMIESFRYLFPNALAENGIYIVEDVHSNYWKRHRDSRTSFVDFTKILMDAMHAHYQISDNELEFQTGHPDRLTEVSVPTITPMLSSIEIYDSVTIVRRGERALPRTILQ